MSEETSNLENLKRELQSSLNALKQQEQALKFIDANETERQASENQFKTELEGALSHLANMPASFSQASKQISSIYTIAQDLSYRINVIDQAYSRCKAASEHVQTFADLVECLGSIESAIQERKVEQSCNYISRLVKIPTTLLSSADIEKINGYKKQTLSLLNDSLNNHDPMNIQKAWQYYQDCNAAYEGIEELSLYQYSFVMQQENPKYMEIVQMPKSHSSDRTAAKHIGTFASFLNALSIKMNEFSKIINDPGQFSICVRILLKQGDKRMKEILDSYTNYRSDSNNDMCSEEITKTPEYLNLICDDISSLSHEYSNFQKYIKTLIKPGLQTKTFTDYCQKISKRELTSMQTGLPMNTEAERTIQMLLTNYFFLTKSFLENVIQNDLLSSLSKFSDDKTVTETIGVIFYSMLKILERTIRTKSAKYTVTIFNTIEELVEKLCNMLRTLQSREISKIAMYINSVDVTKANLTKLIEVVESNLKHFSGDDLIVLKSGLDELRRNNEQLKSQLNKYFNDFINLHSNKIDEILEVFKEDWTNESKEEITYLRKTELESYFSEKFEKNISGFETRLNKSNYAKLKEKVTEAISMRFEKIILTKEFDHAGAMLLNSLIKSFASILVESKLERLKQIANILSQNTASDVVDLWNDDKIAWKLSDKEVIRFAKLKREFNGESFSGISPK